MVCHSRIGVLMAVLAVSGFIFGGLAIGSAAANNDGFVYLTTALTPDQPTTRGDVTLTTTFRSANASTETYEIRSIEIKDEHGSSANILEEVDYSIRNRPSLAPGKAFHRDFSLDFDTPGQRQVIVRAQLVSKSGEVFSVTHSVNITVYRPNPQIEATATPTLPNEESSLNLTVANGLGEAIRDVEVRLSSPTVGFEQPRRIASSIPAGASQTFTFTSRPESLGNQPVSVTLEYTTANGTFRTVTRDVEVPYRSPQLEGDLDVFGEVATAIPGTVTTLNLTVANGFEKDIRQFGVTLEAEGVSINQNRRVGTGLASGEERTFTFAVSRPESGRQPINVTITYATVDGIEGKYSRTLQTTFDEPANPGRVTLTGIQAVQQGDSLEISATASNVGSSSVDAVVVAIGDVPGVAPADFFVGGIDGSDFASFTLTTTASRNVSTVPVEVTYVVDGLERRATTEVRVEQRTVTNPNRAAGPPWLQIGAGAALLVIIGIVVYRWRG